MNTDAFVAPLRPSASCSVGRSSALRAVLVALVAATLAACSSSAGKPSDPDEDPGEVHETRSLRLDESRIRATRAGDGVRVEIPVEALGNAAVTITGRVDLRTLAGEVVGSAEAVERVVRANGQPATDGLQGGGVVVFTVAGIEDLPLSTSDAGALADLVIAYDLTGGSARLFGRRSLFEAWQKYQVHVFSTDRFDVDGESYVRVIAVDPADDSPIAAAAVTIGFEAEGGDFVELFSGVTDEFGVVAAPVGADDSLLGEQQLLVLLQVDGVEERVSAAVSVERQQRVMVTTDKPLYQPGQTIHIRTLTLNRPSLRPAADAPVLIEIQDAEGNKVGRIESTTDAFGVASAEFNLARELNMGGWKISATVADVTTERTVTVDRYNLPKFGVNVQPDRRYYRPGDTAQLYVESTYFFGQPVAGGTLVVQPYTFDVGFNPLPEFEVTLDGAGIARVDVPIPDFLVGLPLEQGGAFVRVDLTVTDEADQTETVTRNLTVAASDLLVTVVPATSILPGEVTSFYVLTSDPTGLPVATESVLRAGPIEVEFTTDARGFAEVSLRSAVDSRSVDFSIEAESEVGSVTREFSFDTGFAADHGAIALRTDRAVYSAGDSVEVSILTGAAVPRVFVDVIRNGQTLLTTTVELTDGRAEHTIDLSPDMVGTLQINAYLVTSDANIVRGDALVLVEDARALSITYAPDREEYRPGQDAVLGIHVTDEQGEGVVAAVGVTIVDEAVFALQDMRPGLERVFFQLEEQLLNPQYNLYGISFESVLAGDGDAPDRETAASVLLAASTTGGHAVAIDTLRPAMLQARSIATTFFSTDSDRVVDRFQTLLQVGAFTHETWNDRAAANLLLEEVGRLYDPWGRPMEIDLAGDEGPVNEIVIRSAGLDEVWGTEDDLSRRIGTWELSYDPNQNDWDDAMPGGGGGGGGWDGEADAGMNPPPVAEPDDGDRGSDAPRVRQFFPETLLVEPSIITGPDGRANLSLSVADSITTWRITGMANSADGQLGSGTGAMRVFQEFFVDINFPVQLTQNDIISVPVAIFNYLDEPQTVNLSVDLEASGDWFTLLSEPTVAVPLQAGEITVRYFEVEVQRVGWRPFQVTAIGSAMSDAVRRVVEVLPDGQEQLIVFSDRLVEDVERTVTIPDEAIDEASALFVKLYPGLFSTIVDGLDGILRMPSGCFEQTSSTTYPNILVLQYMQETGQVTPELELLATEYISQGYQKLVTFEVPGGGFEWFGNDPAHRILTAYGLLEFTDMAQVFPVDPALIERTRAWLLGQQESDGRWRAAAEGIHEGATNNFTDSDLRATAYITYALLESGDRSPGTMSGVSWVKANLTGVTDPYSLALVANLLFVADRTDAVGRRLLDDLDASKRSQETDSGTVFWWESESQSLYYGGGEAMNMETTALALQAFIRGGGNPTTIDGVVGYLIQNKGAFGDFASTQATINSLRAFLMLLSSATTSGDATIRVFLGDELVQTVVVDERSSDLLRLIDLRDRVVEGDNVVRLEVDGEGELLYQIVGRYYLPWSLVDSAPSADIVSIAVDYDRTVLAVDETVGVTATVRNNSDARLDMVMVDLGVPPGFDVIMSDFTPYIDDPEVPVTRVDRAGRQLTVYVYGLDPGQTLELEYRLRATMPLEAATPPSAVWLYYDDGVRSEEEPIVLTVL